jgi:heme-degrading monooxygenase HmoA
MALCDTILLKVTKSPAEAGWRIFFMVTEVAIFNAVSSKEEELGQAILRGLEVIRQHPGCVSAHVTRCIERPGRYMVTVIWTSLEAHTVDFRGGLLFTQWRNHINGLFEPPAEVFHYEAF